MEGPAVPSLLKERKTLGDYGQDGEGRGGEIFKWKGKCLAQRWTTSMDVGFGSGGEWKDDKVKNDSEVVAKGALTEGRRVGDMEERQFQSKGGSLQDDPSAPHFLVFTPLYVAPPIECRLLMNSCGMSLLMLGLQKDCDFHLAHPLLLCREPAAVS